MPALLTRVGVRRRLNLAFVTAYVALTAALVFAGAFTTLTAAAKVEPAPVVRPARASAVTGPGQPADRSEEDGPGFAPLAQCAPAPETPVPNMVAAIFRCRLAEAGYQPDEVRYITAEAVTVARCESRFDTNAVVFDGKWLHQANPDTGFRYSAAGVFQFIRKSAEKWIDGGYANVHDPVRNIDAAARLYIDNVRRGQAGWADWACAAVNDGFAASSVLPGWPGGPDKLPDWAFEL